MYPLIISSVARSVAAELDRDYQERAALARLVRDELPRKGRGRAPLSLPRLLRLARA